MCSGRNLLLLPLTLLPTQDHPWHVPITSIPPFLSEIVPPEGPLPPPIRPGARPPTRPYTGKLFIFRSVLVSSCFLKTQTHKHPPSPTLSPQPLHPPPDQSFPELTGGVRKGTTAPLGTQSPSPGSTLSNSLVLCRPPISPSPSNYRGGPERLLPDHGGSGGGGRGRGQSEVP